MKKKSAVHCTVENYSAVKKNASGNSQVKDGTRSSYTKGGNSGPEPERLYVLSHEDAASNLLFSEFNMEQKLKWVIEQKGIDSCGEKSHQGRKSSR